MYNEINDVEWITIIRQLRDNKKSKGANFCTPVISNRLMGELIFGENNVVNAWAKRMSYPLERPRSLTSVAQYWRWMEKQEYKRKYLDFLNEHLLDHIAPTAPSEFFKDLKREIALNNLTFSQLANDRLHLPDIESQPKNPLRILAQLDFKVFLTTSPHYFIEQALKHYNKTPHTKAYPWKNSLKRSRSTIYSEMDFEPEVDMPLVFHLHGIDDEASSLVLTEDDYFEFLVNISRELRNEKIIPNVVLDAISSSQLLLIGYHIHAWDFRVLLHGMIKDQPNPDPERPRNFIVQLDPKEVHGVSDPEKFQGYLKEYFGGINFDIYWGNSHCFLQELWQRWEDGV